MRGSIVAAAATLMLLTLCAASAFAKPHPDQQGKACAGCHEDAHKGEFATRADRGACASCHVVGGWSPSTFSPAQHTATTKYALDGKHVATPCSGCHGKTSKTSFMVAGSDCLDCHQNPHGQEFAEQQAAGGCVACHTTQSWKQWKVDHRGWVLDGAHARAACSTCHPGKTIATPAAEMRGVPKACAGCHVDVHAKQFGAKTCDGCHATETWSSAPKFDHGKTRYPLEGVHVGMACGKCHRMTELHDGDKVRAWKLPYFECKDCHADPHPKGASGGLDCRGCHAATSWQTVTDPAGKGAFDHDKTGFVLRQSHAKATCTKCHTATTAAKKPAAGETKRTNSTCQACHPDPHMGRMSGQCFECHTAVAWQDTAMFEQHRRTRMPLTGKHAVIECGSCHRRQGERPWRDLPTDCWSCHKSEYTALDSHTGKTGEAAYPRECQKCHTTIDWPHAIDADEIARSLQTRSEHDRVFALTSGAHASVSCDGCHVDRKRMRVTRCDGCHTSEALRGQHAKQPISIAPTAATCLRCHPRGTRR